jgi:hypothetical protein
MTSILDLFKIGIGPSSSHTVGPMRAARRFLEELEGTHRLIETDAVTIHQYGSCIERNAFGAVKAVNAARMAMNELGDHKVSLDQVIRAMFETGQDMQARYKETSLAGLAVNVVEC